MCLLHIYMFICMYVFIYISVCFTCSFAMHSKVMANLTSISAHWDYLAQIHWFCEETQIHNMIILLGVFHVTFSNYI